MAGSGKSSSGFWLIFRGQVVSDMDSTVKDRNLRARTLFTVQQA